MIVKLYALKCEQGYIRYSPECSTLVGLDKASVYKTPDDKGLREAFRHSLSSGTLKLRVVELTLEETDYSFGAL